MQIDQQQVFDVLRTVGTVAGSIAAGTLALATALIPIVRPIIVELQPVLIAWARARVVEARGKEAGATFDALELAIKPGVSAAVVEVQLEWARAVHPSSEGGTKVTAEEYARILDKGSKAAVSALDSQGLLEAATKACGGTEGLTKSILVLLQRDLNAKHGVSRPE
jgi:hypothetical protein